MNNYTPTIKEMVTALQADKVGNAMSIAIIDYLVKTSKVQDQQQILMSQVQEFINRINILEREKHDLKALINVVALSPDPDMALLENMASGINTLAQQIIANMKEFKKWKKAVQSKIPEDQ